MLLKLTRKNPLNEDKETIIETNNIVCIKDKHVEPTRLYDEDDNLVETRESPKLFEIVLAHCPSVFVDETNYKKLVAKLNVETL